MENSHNMLSSLPSVLILFFAAISTAAVPGRTFKRNTDPLVDIVPLSPGWTETSSVSCVARCAREFLTCRSALFNKVTRHCTPGSWLLPSPSARDLTQGTLYSTAMSCNGKAESFTYAADNGVMCAWLSPRRLNYISAREDCIANQARLYTIRTDEKLELLLRHYPPDRDQYHQDKDRYWIGLDDLENEGLFIWADGTALADEWKARVFHPGQPDDHLGVEDCVIYNASFGPLNDIPCNDSWQYICETETSA
ncbi:unnamed protein product [Lymnaea stagnalis]|uniref:C-type lectin domain-containing protein n=1 Tax=Lymnaea stagnalis TaxID=6523 RepID=A0AAV2H163_LYMST